MVRWYEFTEMHARQFVEAFRQASTFEVVNLDGLVAVGAENKSQAVVFGHPLWLQKSEYLNDTQAFAQVELEDAYGFRKVAFTDPWTLGRLPAKVFSILNSRE